MKLLQAILALVAVGVIMLHTLIPHEHFRSSSETTQWQNHECSLSLFMGLQLSLGLDHGEGHFEQFVQFENNLHDLAPLPQPVRYQAFFAQATVSIVEPAIYEKPLSSYCWLRGPPIG